MIDDQNRANNQLTEFETIIKKIEAERKTAK